MQLQGVCHDTLPWLISFSLDRMRYSICGAASICIALAYCATLHAAPRDNRGWDVSRRFSGRYVFGFEVSEFTPSGSRERWWLSGEIGPITHRLLGPHSAVFVTVDGQL